MRIEDMYHGKCSAEWMGTNGDGECYECMFYVDDDCPYLVRGLHRTVRKKDE